DMLSIDSHPSLRKARGETDRSSPVRDHQSKWDHSRHVKCKSVEAVPFFGRKPERWLRPSRRLAQRAVTQRSSLLPDSFPERFHPKSLDQFSEVRWPLGKCSVNP